MPGPATLVREARRAAGLTQAQLAARAGTTQSAIARLESGRTSPTVASRSESSNDAAGSSASSCR